MEEEEEQTSLLTSLSTSESAEKSWPMLRGEGSSRASLMRMDRPRRMKEANRFMWMLFLMQCNFLGTNEEREEVTRGGTDWVRRQKLCCLESH